MSTFDIYKNTLRYSGIRVLIGTILVGSSTIIYLILRAIVSAITDGIIGKIICFIVWFLITAVLFLIEERKFVTKNHLGYIVMLLLALIEGDIPIDQDNLARRMMKNRFKSENRFFLMKRMVQAAIVDLEKVRSESTFSVVYFYIKYMIACCIAYTFCDEEKNIFHGAFDAIIIYGENEEQMNRDNIKALVILIGTSFLAILIPVILFALICHLVGFMMVVGILLGIVFGIALKDAFVDHYFMIVEMEQFLKIASETIIDEELYLAYMEESAMCKRLARKARIYL